MEDTVTMHVIYRLHQLVHVIFDALLRKIMTTPLDGIIHVHLHELENEGKSSCRLIIEDLVELDNLRVRR